MSVRKLAILILGGVGLYLVWRQAQAAQISYLISPSLTSDAPPPDNPVQDIVDIGVNMWAQANVPAQYQQIIADTEQANGIPSGLLARLLYQESRFRPDIISGATRSPVGATGIAQFMPATAAQWGIDPNDPRQAIPAAGQYLLSLYRQFGSWSLALAAYNWGPGNVARKGIAAAPAETRNYVAQITSDVPVA